MAKLKLDSEQQKAIIRALLIGLDSYGEIERLKDEYDRLDYCPGGNPAPDHCRPLHPTGSAETIGIFAEALRYMQKV